MKANDVLERVYLQPSEIKKITYQNVFCVRPLADNSIEYIRTSAFRKKAKEAFCKATCNGCPPRSTCTSLGTCMEYDNFVKFLEEE